MTERDIELAELAEAFADRDFKGEINWSEAYESKLIELVRADAFEQGRQEGMKQERALWELSRLGQEIEAEPEERNFCPRCGKRTADLTTIHTCTPPKDVK